MKTRGLKIVSMLFLMLGCISGMGQNEIEVPGDQFSLEGALELFKKSASPEEFERLLNSSESRVNNLDLNRDGEIDYIRVINKAEGNIHIFILQAVLSRIESQDVAVISLEKLANGKAVLQITGDADVYGVETIIEPTEEVRVYAGTQTTQTVVNVWTWPAVQYVYSPHYTIWVSPWHWHLRPAWWYSWRPVVYYEYYSYWQPYRPYYSPCHTHRIVYAREIYRPYRTYSPAYHEHSRSQITRYRKMHHDNDTNRDRKDGNRNRGDYVNRGDSKNENRERERTTSRDDYKANTQNNAQRNNSTRGQRKTTTSGYDYPANRESSNRSRYKANENKQKSDRSNPTQYETRKDRTTDSKTINRNSQRETRSTVKTDRNRSSEGSQKSRSGNGGKRSSKKDD
jgi:hypothetical protein